MRKVKARSTCNYCGVIEDSCTRVLNWCMDSPTEKHIFSEGKGMMDSNIKSQWFIPVVTITTTGTTITGDSYNLIYDPITGAYVTTSESQPFQFDEKGDLVSAYEEKSLSLDSVMEWTKETATDDERQKLYQLLYSLGCRVFK